MASLCKPTYVRPVPPDAKIVTKGGKKFARIKRRGLPLDCPLSDDGTKITVQSEKWYVSYCDANGKRKRVPAYRDERASRAKLQEIELHVEHQQAGIADPFQEHHKRPLAEHLDDYRGAMRAKGNTPLTVSNLCGKVEKLLEGCKYRHIPDMLASPERASTWLAERRAAGLSACTSNGYLGALKGFCHWLVTYGRMAKHPFLPIRNMNAAVDRRRERRAEPMTTIWRIIETAKTSGRKVKGLSGPDRAIVYTAAAYTGFRAQELASLTPASMNLDGDMPTITVQACHSKHRRQDVQPIPRDLADLLTAWSGGLARDAKFWPGYWWKHAAEMLRVDLAAAGVPYEDEDGLVFDFHAFRHSYITHVARSGADPKTVQRLARHASFQITFDRYSHVSLSDSAAALDCLPSLPESQQMRATGTDNTLALQLAPPSRPAITQDARCLPLPQDKDHAYRGNILHADVTINESLFQF
ncbi:MAG: tyrosine-type recombinase/integrase [Pirellulales bacterium]